MIFKNSNRSAYIPIVDVVCHWFTGGDYQFSTIFVIKASKVSPSLNFVVDLVTRERPNTAPLPHLF